MLVGYHDESSDEKLQELEEEWKKTGSVVAWCGRFEPPQNEGFSYQQMVVMPKNGGTPKWMVYHGKSQFGVPLFEETSKWVCPRIGYIPNSVGLILILLLKIRPNTWAHSSWYHSQMTLLDRGIGAFAMGYPGILHLPLSTSPELYALHVHTQSLRSIRQYSNTHLVWKRLKI